MAQDKANPRHLNLLGVLEVRLGRKEAARQRFAQVLSRFPRNPSALTNMGNLAFLDGDEKTACQYYLKALRENPFLQEPRHNLVRTYQYTGNFEKAMSAFEDYVIVRRLSRWFRASVLLTLLLLTLFLIARR